ncbi:MAG: hypothetical protein ACK4UO_08965 [Pseudolabrys sp.]
MLGREEAAEAAAVGMARAISIFLGSAGAAAPRPYAVLRAFLADFWRAISDPYRPELHYMRGPGPAWRAKHPDVSTPG